MSRGRFVGWRYGVFIGSFVGAVGLFMYAVALDPYLNTNKWRNIQKETRKDIDQAAVQPPGLKVWSDPFDRPKN